MLFGLGLGLAVALVVYVRGPGQVPRSGPSSAPRPEARTAEPPAARARTLTPTPESRFDFYEMLPKFEVVLPEVESDPRPDNVPAAVEDPGSYVVQVGSFTAREDADRMQASLALLGIESHIQRVTIDDAVFHRVRIGPLNELTELNRVRRQLRDARIESLLLRVPG